MKFFRFSLTMLFVEIRQELVLTQNATLIINSLIHFKEENIQKLHWFNFFVAKYLYQLFIIVNEMN